MHWDNYTEDHLSVVSNSDYHGSVVAASHWLYWGSRRIECCSRSFSLRIIEQCDFIDDHLFTPVAKKPYTERCFATDIRVETPKVAYICKEQLGHEWKYHREVLEAGDFSVHAFVLVSDISLTGEAAHLQECFLAQALPRLCKLKLPFILATSKHDCFAPPENQIFLNRLMKQYKKALHKNKFCRLETSARLGINVSELFMSAALMASSHSHDLNRRHFRYHAPDHLTDAIINGYCPTSPSTRKNGRKMDTISSLYADTNTMHLQDNSKLFYQPASSCVSEDLTYDLPVNEDADPGPGICVHGTTQLQVGTASPAAMSATTTTTVSPVSINVDVGFCETTITPSPLPPFILSKSNLPTNASVIPTAGVLDRSHRAHNHQLHRPLLQSAVSDANPEILSLTTEDSGAFQPLLLLFLHGPQASSLRSLLHAKCRLDRFQLADGRWFRIWIFDAVDALGMQISPSKWQPPHTMKPSSTAPSAFSKLMPSSCIDSARGASVSAAAESSVTAGSPSSSTAANQDGCTSDAQNDHSRRKAHSVESTNQLRLSLWVGGSSDFLATETGQNDNATPAAIPVASAGYQLDALVWFSSQAEYLNRQALLASTSRQSSPPPIPSCSSTRLKTLDRSLDLASSLGIPLFHTSDSSAAQFLSHILSYVGPVAARIKAVQQSEAAPSDSCPDPSPPLLFHDLPIPLEVLCQLCRGPDDIPVTAATESSSRVLSTTLASLRCGVSVATTHEDLDRRCDLPSVAIGIDYVSCPASGSSGPPLVLFTTVSQALKLLSSEADAEDQTTKQGSLRFRFVILHFLAAQWSRMGAEISAQLPCLLNAAYAYCQSRAAAAAAAAAATTACRLLSPTEGACCSSTSSLESVVKTYNGEIGRPAAAGSTPLVGLVALTSDEDTTGSTSTAGVSAGRQLVSGLAATQGCPVMHPRSLYGSGGGVCCPPSCYSPVPSSESGDDRAHDPTSKPSLAFLHLNGSFETDFELYQQILRADMSGWLTSHSPTFHVVSVGGRCSRGDSCEVCHKQTDSNFKATSLQELASQSAASSAWPVPITNQLCSSPPQAAQWTSISTGITDGLYADAGCSFSTPKAAAATAGVPEPRLLNEQATTAVSEDRLLEYYADFPSLRPDLNPIHRVLRPKRPQVRSSRCSSMGSLTVSSVVTSSNSSPERPPSIQSSVSSSTPPTSFVPDSGGGAGVAFSFGGGRTAINDSGVVLLSRLSRQTLTMPLCSQPPDSFTDSGAYPCLQHVCVSSSSSAMAAKAVIGRGSSAPKVGSGPRVSASSPATMPLVGPPQAQEGSLTTESVSELSEYVATEENCHFLVDDARLTQLHQRPEAGDPGPCWCDEEQFKEQHWQLSSQINRCSIVAPNPVLAPLLVDRTLLASSNDNNVYDVPQSDYYLLDQTNDGGAAVYTTEGAQAVTFCHQCQPEEPLVVPVRLSNRASSPALPAYSRPPPPQRVPAASSRSCGGWLPTGCFSLPRSQSSTRPTPADTFYFARGTDSKNSTETNSSRMVASPPALDNTALNSSSVTCQSPALNPESPVTSLASTNNVGCRSYRQPASQRPPSPEGRNGCSIVGAFRLRSPGCMAEAVSENNGTTGAALPPAPKSATPFSGLKSAFRWRGSSLFRSASSSHRRAKTNAT